MVGLASSNERLLLFAEAPRQAVSLTDPRLAGMISRGLAVNPFL
jgi:hypothetical protein